MPRTIEGIVASHQAATELRRAGRPIWAHRVNLADVFRNDELRFEQRRDAIVRRLRKSPWARDNYTLGEMLAAGLVEAHGWSRHRAAAHLAGLPGARAGSGCGGVRVGLDKCLTRALVSYT